MSINLKHPESGATTETSEPYVEMFLSQGWVHDDGETPAPTTIEAILADVGDDPVKAQEALNAEAAKGAKARPTLVEQLQAIITPPS
jgi:hypothetical protein